MSTLSSLVRKPRKKNPTPNPGFFDERLRYRIPIASQFLGQSESKTYAQIAAGEIPVIREGGNTFIPGIVIARACSVDKAA